MALDEQTKQRDAVDVMNNALAIAIACLAAVALYFTVVALVRMAS